MANRSYPHPGTNGDPNADIHTSQHCDPNADTDADANTSTNTLSPLPTSTPTLTLPPPHTATATPSLTPTASFTASPTTTLTAIRTASVTPTITFTPTTRPTATSTASPTLAVHDAVVLARRPLTITLARGAVAPVTKKLTVGVHNADSDPASAATIVLSQTNDCPAGVAVLDPDFDSRAADIQSSATINGGKTKVAILRISVDHSLTTLNRKTPARCTIRLTAGFQDPTIDPNPSNNQAVVELNLYDKLDTDAATSDETVMQSLSPATLRVPPGKASVTKKLKMVATNADIVPVKAVPGHDIAVSLNDNGCGLLCYGSMDLSPGQPGAQSDVVVAGGMNASGSLNVTATSSLLTPNKHSPLRCLLTFTASGPTNPDDEPSNNSSTMVIDLLDANDY